jgi:hypothetical protein
VERIEGFEKIMAYGGIGLTYCREPLRQFKHLQVRIRVRLGHHPPGPQRLERATPGQVVLPIFPALAAIVNWAKSWYNFRSPYN